MRKWPKKRQGEYQSNEELGRDQLIMQGQSRIANIQSDKTYINNFQNLKIVAQCTWLLENQYQPLILLMSA